MTRRGSAERQTLEQLLRTGNESSAELQGSIFPQAPKTQSQQSVVTQYLYDYTLPYGQLLTETTDSVTTAYTYGLDRLSAITGESAKQAYAYDGRGSVALTVGTVAMQTPTAPLPTVQSYAYTPFGESIGAESSGFGFNAEYFDAATGMQYLRARVYEPAMGRFGQKDALFGSLVNPLSRNRYLYARDNSLNLIDPSGMETCSLDLDALEKKAYNINNDRSIQGLNFSRMKGAVETYIVTMMNNENVMNEQAVNDGASVDEFWANFSAKTGVTVDEMDPLYYWEQATNEDKALVNRMIDIRPQKTAITDGYAANCGIAANIAAAAAGVQGMPNYYSEAFLEDTSFSEARNLFTITNSKNQKADLTAAGIIAKQFEDDPSFIDKVEVRNKTQLTQLMQSPLAQNISVVGVDFDGKIPMNTKFGEGIPGYDHIIVAKRTIQSPKTGLTYGTFMGASRYRNDMPYDFIFDSDKEQDVVLVFYLNKSE